MRAKLEWHREGECIICTSPKTYGDGYPQMERRTRDKRVVIRIHRIVCERRHGPIGSLLALHSCDNHRCINPDHLRPGTSKDNVLDRMTRGRSGYTGNLGEKNGSAVLTASKVKEIRASKKTEAELAEQFGVHECTISRIKRRVTWQHEL